MRRRIEFDGSYRVASRDSVVRGNSYTDAQGLKLNWVHPPDWCEGRPCVVHNPSDHCMRLFPTNWRWDRGIMERICPHGIGHPDPDDLAFHVAHGITHQGIHGCDGCCSPIHSTV